MWRWALGSFLMLHGLVHGAIWLTPGDEGDRFDPTSSWLFGALGLGETLTRLLSLALALEVTVGFVLVGIGLVRRRWWWRPEGIVAAAAGLALLVVYFNPWLSVGLLIEGALLGALLMAHWPADERSDDRVVR